jgi:hypothetical protein
MIVVKKLIAMLVLAGFLCGTFVMSGCGTPTSEKPKPAGEKPAEKPPSGS